MKYIYVVLIKFYQRFISPYKGFHCAHHVVHGKDTCSNAVKSLLLKYGLLKALPFTRHHFDECRSAYDYLQTDVMRADRIDIPCDLPCDIGIGDCGGGSSAKAPVFECLGFCDWPFDTRHLSKRTKRLLVTGLILLVLVLSYVFYGRQIDAVYVTDLGQRGQSLVTRMVQRENPELRVMLLVDGEKYYSDILKLDELGIETKFTLERSISDFTIDRLEILDARVNVAGKLVVVGQILETFDNAPKQAKGKRFSYRIERRWHF